MDRGENEVSVGEDGEAKNNDDITGDDDLYEDEEEVEGDEEDRLQGGSNYQASLNNNSQANLTNELMPKKRTVRKKVTRPRHANNPFLVYSIYFTNQNQSTTNQQLEQKLKPWERNYFHNLNNRMRGAHSVTAGDSRSFMQGIQFTNSSGQQ